MRYIETEEYGFPRSFFPIKHAGHEIHILHNDAHETVDNRFQIHYTLHCPRCEEEKTVRGRLPPESTEYNYRSAVAKLIALGHFNNTCTGGKNHTYYGP